MENYFETLSVHLCPRYPGAVFTKGLSQVLGLTFVQKYSQLKPKTWLRPSVNTAPGQYTIFTFSNKKFCNYLEPTFSIHML